MASYDFALKMGLWDTSNDYMDFPDPLQIRQSYERARVLCQKSGMTVDDIVKMTPKFWNFNRHLVVVRDVANFDICGEFLLTEIGHGLDARNIETTATLQPDGSFDLHSPTKSAPKAMPPSTPWAGMRRVGVVFARLLANGVDCGVKPFVVMLNDGNQMCPGITSRALPTRNGSKAVDHAITTFNHVRLGQDSLLGSPKPSSDPRAEFFNQISRVTAGTLAISLWNIPALRHSAYIAGTYSLRRHVAGDGPGQRVPIISFATQYRPILTAIAQASVFDAFADEAMRIFVDGTISPVVRHGVVACFKATVTVATQTTLNELTDRCGWQGLFAYNRILEIALSVRGNSIAEGDYTVLCIRLATEILLGRYELPPSRMKDCLLARHEAGVWQEAKEAIASLPRSNHRGHEFNAHILPRCRALIEATGHRMAYEAAFTSGIVSPEVLRLFESICVMYDLSWYCDREGGNLSKKDILKSNVEAVEAVLPQLRTLLDETKAASWADAPIVKEATWDGFVQRLPTFRRNEAVLEQSRL
ncbi:putative acyl-CoA oxidase [Hypoxylon sp. NC1633]|nr:putative acyl-CoA oxidase [Hypoxylon sp. NC1633]